MLFVGKQEINISLAGGIEAVHRCALVAGR
jgi:hypothetical protein